MRCESHAYTTGFVPFGLRGHPRFLVGSTKQGKLPLPLCEATSFQNQSSHASNNLRSPKKRKESVAYSTDLVCPFCGDHTSWADCKCLNYSRVFNARNSFASIAQQSTPLQTNRDKKLCKNTSFVDISDTDSQFLLTPIRSSVRTCEPVSDHQRSPGEEARSGDTGNADSDEVCGSQVMSQLATQLSECVLSP